MVEYLTISQNLDFIQLLTKSWKQLVIFMSEILIKIPKEMLLELLKHSSLDEPEAITIELKTPTSPLHQQLERARARVKPLSVEQSTFFALPPIDIGKTEAEELDKIIAEDAYVVYS